MLKIAIGTDHRGFVYKQFLVQLSEIAQQQITWIDVGAYSDQRSDYPEFAHKVVQLLREKKVDIGILLCGSGIGMAIAANRFRGIYAGVAWNKAVARMAKEDDHVNVLVIPADFCTFEDVRIIIQEWITASPKEGRYVDRLIMIDSLS